MQKQSRSDFSKQAWCLSSCLMLCGLILMNMPTPIWVKVKQNLCQLTSLTALLFSAVSVTLLCQEQPSCNAVIEIVVFFTVIFWLMSHPAHSCCCSSNHLFSPSTTDDSFRFWRLFIEQIFPSSCSSLINNQNYLDFSRLQG